MLKFVTIAAGALLLQASLVEASECKGLAEDVCTATAACGWNAQRIAGETKTKAGVPHKSSAKAHCRAKPVRREAASKAN